MTWVLPFLSNSWIRIMVWLYIVLNRTPNIDRSWGGQYPNYDAYYRYPKKVPLILGNPQYTIVVSILFAIIPNMFPI